MRDVRASVLTLFCATMLAHAPIAHGQTIEPAFHSDIQKLLEISGSAQLSVQAATLISRQILDSLKTSNPQIPERALELAKQALDSELEKAFSGPDNLTEQMVNIYARHFTHEEVRGLLTFYCSDLGKKVIVSMPVIFQEGAAAGQQWATKQMPRIATLLEGRLRAEGFIK